MGLLRTLLALSVVLYHSWPHEVLLVGGESAVECFYIISGFLISYILVERRSYASLGAFYINRYLRLYPIYAVVALLTLAAILVTKRTGFLEIYHTAPASAIALLTFANATLFGMDWILFLGVKAQHLVFVTNFMDTDVPLFKGQIIHPAWTLGVELSFYLLAPFILPRRALMVCLVILSLGLRLYLIHLGFGGRDPWTYRFFPTELALFLLGALAHQVLLPLYGKLSERGQRRAAYLATSFLIGFCLIYFLLHVDEIYKRLFLLAAFTSLIPLTFMFQRLHRFDSWIGNLSYPIYIAHILVLLVSNYVLKHLGITDERVASVCCVVACIVFAIALNQFVGAPVEKIRQHWRARGKSRVPTAP